MQINPNKLARWTVEGAAGPDHYMAPLARVVRNVIDGVPVLFTVNNPRDTIQAQHAEGRFYEEEELEIIRKWCPPGAVFCDIGANIGNHSLFALKFLGVAKVIPFEPNPDAIALLLSNLTLNGEAGRCDLRHLGQGLSDRAAEGLAMAVDQPRDNLGGGRMVEEGGALRVVRGDDVLGDTAVGFIKIDVEGMELAVLRGLEATIARNRPVMFIEVDEVNRADFLAWVDAQGYQVSATYRRYKPNENFLITAKGAGA